MSTVIKLLKVGNSVYENIPTTIQHPTEFDENGTNFF